MTIDELKPQKGYKISELCQLFDIPRSSYYKWINRKKPPKELQDELLGSLILEYHKSFNQILGYRRMTIYINKFNQSSYSVNYIYRLMRKYNIKSRIRKNRYNYIKVKPEQIGENILNRDFKALYPNQKWCTDVTEFKVPGEKKKLYLSAIIDLYDRSIISYKLCDKNNNQLVFDTFNRAIKSNPYAKPIFHSDRGFQYTSKIFKLKLDNLGMIQSMSRVGKCIDNGPMEGFWGTLKSESFYGLIFQNETEIRSKIEEYIFFYNNIRIQTNLKSMTPNEYRYHA